LSERLQRLEKLLGYRFVDVALAETALRHRSAGGEHNERLEYLGDAVLGFVIARELYLRFPKAAEGELSRLRAGLVRGKTLGEIAQSIGLGDLLILGSGELKSGGVRRESILAGALEALLGAVYLDGGLAAAEAVITALFNQRLAACSPDAAHKDFKTQLQEFLQGRRSRLPVYQTVNVQGAEHAQTFTVTCTVEGLPEPTVGVGASRRTAEQQAAERALAQLKGEMAQLESLSAESDHD